MDLLDEHQTLSWSQGHSTRRPPSWPVGRRDWSDGHLSCSENRPADRQSRPVETANLQDVAQPSPIHSLTVIIRPACVRVS